MINPVGKEVTGEWITLHNRGNRKTRVRNWKLVDGQGREARLDASIGAGESLRLHGRSQGKVKLSNSGGSLMLPHPSRFPIKESGTVCIYPGKMADRNDTTRSSILRTDS
ncbi:MAG: hypothetical protein ACI87O_000620 [Planctomycetota bacterium]|jgi:hypothetical protein